MPICVAAKAFQWIPDLRIRVSDDAISKPLIDYVFAKK